MAAEDGVRIILDFYLMAAEDGLGYFLAFVLWLLEIGGLGYFFVSFIAAEDG